VHPKAIQKIEKKIKGSLINCYIKDSRPQYESFTPHVESLEKEILKHTRKWMDLFDVFFIFYEFVYEAIENKTANGKKLEGNLWDILGEEEGQKLTESIKNYIISIPRTYDIYIPFPNISESLPKSINLSNDISLIVFVDKEEIPGGYQKGIRGIFSEQLELNKLYYKQRLNGYCGRQLENISLKRAVNNFKILLHQGIYKKLFKLSPVDKARVGLQGMMAHYQVPKVNVSSVDITGDSNKLKTAELPLDFSILLDNISFDFENVLLAKAKEIGQLAIAIDTYLKKAIELIECDDEESKRVKASIQWCFDSHIARNKTLAFLQVCIGLEALLGDDSPTGSLTATLADRCSYLISPDIKGRKQIKKDFEDLYEVRSKLVHGNVLELDSSQNWYLNWGRKILEYAIAKEIEHLTLGNT
jgi:hypothetical protein